MTIKTIQEEFNRQIDALIADYGVMPKLNNLTALRHYATQDALRSAKVILQTIVDKEGK